MAMICRHILLEGWIKETKSTLWNVRYVLMKALWREFFVLVLSYSPLEPPAHTSSLYWAIVMNASFQSAVIISAIWVKCDIIDGSQLLQTQYWRQSTVTNTLIILRRSLIWAIMSRRSLIWAILSSSSHRCRGPSLTLGQSRFRFLDCSAAASLDTAVTVPKRSSRASTSMTAALSSWSQSLTAWARKYAPQTDDSPSSLRSSDVV